MKSNHSVNTLEEDPAAFAGVWMGIVSRLLEERLEGAAAQAGLTAPGRLIPVYMLIPMHGAVTTADLSRALGCSHQLMKKWLDELARQKHVRRVLDPNDARKIGVELTAKGRKARAVVKAIVAQHGKAVRAAIGGPNGLRTEALPQIAAKLSADR